MVFLPPCPIFMNTETFYEKLRQNPRPVVVDLWAPWCGPCKMVKPILEKLAQEYAGRVDLWQINADDNQDLLRELKVYGIPTLIVYRNSKETLRQVGAKPASALKNLFETLATGHDPAPAGLSSADRLIRFGAGIAVAWIGWAAHANWILLILGGILLFGAVYDRCPIWRALTNQYKKLMAK
jgi:thioredoxin